MALDTGPIRDAITSHAKATGRFERVTGHEMKAAPGSGLTCEVWRQRTRATAQSSGLAVTSARVEFTARIRSGMLAEPQDEIDPNQDAAADALLTALVGDFTLGGTVRSIDMLGETGEPLGLQAGYLEQDHKLYRVIDLTVPVTVNDCWTQAP